MLNKWLSTGVLALGLALVGCSDGGSDDGELGGSGDNLKGRDKDPEPSESKPEQEEPKHDGASACAALLCPVDTKCVVEEVQCIRAPCPPIASCQPIEPPASCAVTLCAPPKVCVEGTGCVEPTAASCAATLCKQGTFCVEGPKGAECIEPGGAGCAAVLCEVGNVCVEGPDGPKCVLGPKPDTTGPGCGVVLCKPGTTCVEGPKGAQCVEPKCTAKCSAGQHCELQEVQCIKAPCDPVPTCVDDLDACATVKCKAGFHCESVPVQCLVAPCPEHAECVAN
ncbi:MAG: hypothetical protein ABW352_02895 [Polyangiales bacterium]